VTSTYFSPRLRTPSKFSVAIVGDDEIVKLVKKPEEFISDLAIVGTYIFRDLDLMKKVFKILKPSWRGEFEIIELIQQFIDDGYRVDYNIVPS
jgi:glucose-1-phosphate thymidylyltransferase